MDNLLFFKNVHSLLKGFVLEAGRKQGERDMNPKNGYCAFKLYLQC